MRTAPHSNHYALPGPCESLRPAVLNPGRLVQEIAASFRPAAAGKGLKFNLEICSGWHDVVIEGGIVRQIVGNLLHNAIEHTSAGWVRLAVTPPDAEHWSITIEHSGNGIVPRQNARVLESFDGTTASASSLETCRQLTERLHGTISLRRAQGKGLLFQVRLPVMVWE